MSRDRPTELGGGYGQLRWDDESLIWFGNSCVTRLPVLFLRVTVQQFVNYNWGDNWRDGWQAESCPRAKELQRPQ
ncbi:hypothetical protein NEUTE2DRAFT_128943 [Neurospora tetrasperma FGSC 2509]|nr:hypothetical protein NEUTE2DRAFT_128943 [Neurospora tetrasperma FGSC 2509]